MAVSILLFGRFVGLIAMPTLAALLIVIGFRTLKPVEAGAVWQTGAVQRAVMVLTFALALFIPLQYAVLFGVALAVVLYVFQQSNQVRLVAWEMASGQYPVEVAPPAVIPSKQVTILYPHGSLFYAATPIFSQQLPKVTDASHDAVVILVLRGKYDIGSTFWTAVGRYADALRQRESKLILAGVDPEVHAQIARTGFLYALGQENVFVAEDALGLAVFKAKAAAEQWIAVSPGRASSVTQ